MATNNDQPRVPALPTPMTQANDVLVGQLGSAQAGSPRGPAEDAEIIDPAWISRVEDVMRTHAHDPKELARQLSVVRAEYIARRYGITLKQGSDRG